MIIYILFIDTQSPRTVENTGLEKNLKIFLCLRKTNFIKKAQQNKPPKL